MKDKEIQTELEYYFKTKMKLTPSQTLVSCLILTGITNLEIANKLFLAEKTVKWHITCIFQRAKVSSRAAFIVKSFREGVVK